MGEEDTMAEGHFPEKIHPKLIEALHIWQGMLQKTNCVYLNSDYHPAFSSRWIRRMAVAERRQRPC
jgi:hypothetical protein